MSSPALKLRPLALLVAGLPLCAFAEQAAVTLQDVVVTATMTERDKATTPAFTTVITAQDIAKAPVNSIPDLLRDTVGVNSQTTNTGRDEIQIRGLDGRYTLILVDGKRVSSSGALWRGSDFDMTTIPLGSIERIEVVRGPMSALYGSDAMGGVVNIITKRPTRDWKGQVAAEYRKIDAGDKGDQRRVNASVSGALSDKVSLSLAAEAYDRDAWYTRSASDPTEVASLEEKQARNVVATTKIQLNAAQSLDVDLGYNYDKRPYALDSYAYYPAWNYESKSYAAQDITRYTYGLTHNAKWDWGRTVSYVKQEDADINDYSSSYDAPQQRALKERNTYLKSYGVVRLGSNVLTAGVDYHHQLIKDPVTYLDSGKVTTNNQALFAQDELALGDSWLVTLGGRLDHHEVFGTHFTPKTYLTYLLSDSVTIKGGVGASFKAPDAYQLSKEYRIISCGGSCYLSGNPDLKPETSKSYEFGVDWRNTGWGMSAAVFHNDVKDMIVAVYDASVPSRQWSNVAKAKTSGLELEGDVVLTHALSLTGNFTVLRADYTDAAGKKTKLEFRPRQKANLGLNWKLSNSVSAGISANYIGRQYYEEEALPSYTRFDLSTATQIGKDVTVRAGIKNLTDVNLRDKSGKFVANELGRNYYVSMAYAF